MRTQAVLLQHIPYTRPRTRSGNKRVVFASGAVESYLNLCIHCVLDENIHLNTLSVGPAHFGIATLRIVHTRIKSSVFDFLKNHILGRGVAHALYNVIEIPGVLEINVKSEMVLHKIAVIAHQNVLDTCVKRKVGIPRALEQEKADPWP
jgi:hypothetical protein